MRNYQKNPDCPFCGTRLKCGKMIAWKCKGCNRFLTDADVTGYKSNKQLIDEWRRNNC